MVVIEEAHAEVAIQGDEWVDWLVHQVLKASVVLILKLGDKLLLVDLFADQQLLGMHLVFFWCCVYFFCIFLAIMLLQCFVVIGCAQRRLYGRAYRYILYEPEYLWVLFGLFPLPLLPHKCPQHTHSLLPVGLEVKSMHFGYPELAVVVIQALLGDSNHLSSLGQAQLLPSPLRMVPAGLVKRPPLSYQLDGLPDCPFLASIFSWGAPKMR